MGGCEGWILPPLPCSARGGEVSARFPRLQVARGQRLRFPAWGRSGGSGALASGGLCAPAGFPEPGWVLRLARPRVAFPEKRSAVAEDPVKGRWARIQVLEAAGSRIPPTAPRRGRHSRRGLAEGTLTRAHTTPEAHGVERVPPAEGWRQGHEPLLCTLETGSGAWGPVRPSLCCGHCAKQLDLRATWAPRRRSAQTQVRARRREKTRATALGNAGPRTGQRVSEAGLGQRGPHPDPGVPRPQPRSAFAGGRAGSLG